ncbi:hydroxymethylpyrimidine/phosphomethylpyrimidine kinase [candidate division WOR-3 bacterium]|nr:hydroxymethylpyrimidine/phosphomethylpyrimidine kinase [candidate division WOR-3 bacterium]
MLVISIAGLDPSTGAGILRDVSVFSSEGFSSYAIPTALTIQSPEKVFNIIPVSIDYIREMLERIEEHIDGIKIGMLYNEEVIRIIVEFLKKRNPPYVVIDPVIKSSSGYPLLSKEGVKALKTSLLPLATVVTPNREEGKILSNEQNPEDICHKLHSLGVQNIVITGINHRDDYFFDGDSLSIIKGKPIDFSFHGSGCFYSSYLLTRLVSGDTPIEAAKRSKKAIERIGINSCC